MFCNMLRMNEFRRDYSLGIIYLQKDERMYWGMNGGLLVDS